MQHDEEVGTRSSYGAVIPASRATRDGQPLCIGASADEPNPEAGPVVELVREGGVIRAIDITCPCGERIRVRCTYE